MMDHSLSLVSSSSWALPSSLQLPNLTMSSTSIFPSVATKYVISNYCIHELIIFISLINKVTEYIIQRNITSCQSIQQRCFPLSTNPRRGVAEGTTWPDRLFLNALHSKQNQELIRLKKNISFMCERNDRPLSLERLLMSSWIPSFPNVSFKYIAAEATSSGVTFPS